MSTKWQHTYGSPWWFASTPDEGFWAGICEYRTGSFRLYTATCKSDLQTGDSWYQCGADSLAAAKREAEFFFDALTRNQEGK